MQEMGLENEMMNVSGFCNVDTVVVLYKYKNTLKKCKDLCKVLENGHMETENYLIP